MCAGVHPPPAGRVRQLPRHQRCQPTVPACSLGGVADGQPWRDYAAVHDHDGGPIDARKSPTAVNNLAMNKSHSWFEKQCDHRVPSNFPRAARHPGFCSTRALWPPEPGQAPQSHYDYFKDLIKVTMPAPTHTASSTTNTTRCWDMDADYYLRPSKSYFKSSPWSTALGTSKSEHGCRARAPTRYTAYSAHDRRG